MNVFTLNNLMDAQSVKPEISQVSCFEAQFFNNGIPRVVNASEIRKYDNTTIRYAMQLNGLYVWPTLELLEWLSKNITDNTIEIGSGNGVLAEKLCVPATDSMMQSHRFKPKNQREKGIWKMMVESYRQTDIPFVMYGLAVQRLDYKDAIRKYKPSCVFGGYITHKHRQDGVDGNLLGVDEDWILKRKFLEKYIMVGNLKVHQHKYILKHKHEQVVLDGLIVRAEHQNLNRIFVWNKGRDVNSVLCK
jgi:hypothetical protein